ncbi:MAG: GMC family oxidoreductase N-terminal domain-containing protein [Acidobacteriota bacterium]
MRPVFVNTISAFCYSIVGEESQGLPACDQVAVSPNAVVNFVLDQYARMPDYLRLALFGLTLGFAVDGFRYGGAVFHRLDPAARRRQIAAWRNSRVHVARDFVRLYESLAVFCWYSLRVAHQPRRDPTPGRDRPASPRFTDHGTESPRQTALRCEVAIIGSGPGGAITACLLAEAGRDVLLVEEGPYLRLDSCVPFSMEEMALKYRNGGLTTALGPVKVQYAEGRCVGGGSEINSGLYHRTPAEILDQWAREFGVEGMSEAELRPHFEACEADLSVGLWPGEMPAPSRKLRDGALRLQWRFLEVPRWYQYDAHFSSNGGPKGRRQSMTETYVPRALRAGCRLLPDTRVVRLRRDASARHWALEAEPSGGKSPRITIEAESVFVCGGAVQSPALLRRSGIRENVGNDLRLHPMIKLVAQFPDEVNSIDMGVPSPQVKEFAPLFTFGSSISTPPYLAIGLRDHPDTCVAKDWRRMAVYYAATFSRGRGSIRSVPGWRDPLVRYRISKEDLQQLSAALQRLGSLLFEAGATALYPSVAGGTRLTSPADLSRLGAAVTYARTNLMTVHLFSSCPMGEDRRRCATDSFGKVHGHSNLYVSDASLLCSPPGVNPQGSIMALARRNALRFLGR